MFPSIQKKIFKFNPMTFFRYEKSKENDTVFFIEHKYTGHCDAVGLQKPHELFFILFLLSAKIVDVVMLTLLNCRVKISLSG